MGLFRKASRVAKKVAKNAILPEDASKSKKEAKAKEAEAPVKNEHTDAEYDALKEKYDALMRAKWEEYYKTSCDGECETCEYYDWCPDDFEDEQVEEESDVAEELEEEPDAAEEPEEESEPERELTEEERAAKEAAEAYYADGCDGECENCEHYDWCPAEEENPDDKVLFKGVTQGEVKQMAKGGVELARESALAVRDLKDAMDDIMGGLDVKNLLK